MLIQKTAIRLLKNILSEARKLRFRILGIRFGEGFYLSKQVHVHRPSNIVIGNFCSIGEFSHLWNFAEIRIGDDFIGAAELSILTGTHDPDTLEPSAIPVTIGNRVWCGAQVTILPGTTIGDDVVIGAGSLVRGNIPPHSIFAGRPAKLIRLIDIEKRNTHLWGKGKIKI